MKVRTQAIVFTAAAAMFAGVTAPMSAQQQTDTTTPTERREGQPGARDVNQQPGANTPDARELDRTRDSARTGDTQGDSLTRQLQEIRQGKTEQALDKVFVICASQENNAEVEFARQAMNKTKNAQIKQICQTIISDHQQMQQKFQQAARELNIQLPQQSSAPQAMKVKQEILLSLPDEQFDKVYLAHLKACHAASVSMYQDLPQLATSQSVKNLAQEGLPKLREHQQAVAQAGQSVGLASTDREMQP